MKQVIVVNEDLNLPRGKLAAQVAHASVASLLGADADTQRAWLSIGMPKIVLTAIDEKTVIDCHEKAVAAKLATHLIKDAGKTVVAAGTITCVGIGPASKTDIDLITGQLGLLR